MRGINSRANVVTRRSASARIGRGSDSGSHSATRICLSCNRLGTDNGSRIGGPGPDVNDDLAELQLGATGDDPPPC